MVRRRVHEAIIERRDGSALGAEPFQCRGTSQAVSLTGLPVYFTPGIPRGAIISVSIGIFWALVVAVLLLLPSRRPPS
jgi:hypothetical protein